MKECHQDVILGNNALRGIALESTFKINRDVDITVYKAWHEHGFVTLYKNVSNNKRLEEIIEYNMKGLEIEGLESEKLVSISIGPQQEQLIKLKNTGEVGSERKLKSKILKQRIIRLNTNGSEEEEDSD